MILKANTNDRFTLTMTLNINYDLAYIEVVVCLNNYIKHTAQTKTFPASKFDEALRYYKQQEGMFI